LTAAIDSAPYPVRALVVDADGLSDVDFAAAERFAEFARGLRQRGVITAIARSSHLVHHDLKHSGLLAEIGPQHVYLSVQEAVAAVAVGDRPGIGHSDRSAPARRPTLDSGPGPDLTLRWKRR
jgi:MFS superfamily sulfate permease-like transporter